MPNGNPGVAIAYAQYKQEKLPLAAIWSYPFLTFSIY